MGDALFILVLALMVFGPSKLPQLARQLGHLMAEFNRAKSDFTSRLQQELDELPKDQSKLRLPDQTQLWSGDPERVTPPAPLEEGHYHAEGLAALVPGMQ